MRLGLIVLLFVCLAISPGCKKSDKAAKPDKVEPTNVVTDMNIQREPKPAD